MTVDFRVEKVLGSNIRMFPSSQNSYMEILFLHDDDIEKVLLQEAMGDPNIF